MYKDGGFYFVELPDHFNCDACIVRSVSAMLVLVYVFLSFGCFFQILEFMCGFSAPDVS